MIVSWTRGLATEVIRSGRIWGIQTIGFAERLGIDYTGEGKT